MSINTLGDRATASVIDFHFTTIGSAGTPTTLSGTPAISVYKGNSTTESTTGVTLDVDFDGRTGMNHVRIDTSTDGTFYASGGNFSVVITTGTVGGTSVVGYVVGYFTLNAANIAAINSTAQTARDIGASVLLSSGTGTGQLDFTSGVVKANLAQILGTALTETAGQIAAAFKKFFDIASPTSTANHITLVDTTTTLTNAPSDSSGTATLLGRLTATRAGYLDNLSGGAVALAATALSTATWTNARAGYLDILNTGVPLAASQGAITFASFTCTGEFLISNGWKVRVTTANKHAVDFLGDGNGDGLRTKGGNTSSGEGGYGLRALGGATTDINSNGGTGLYCEGGQGSATVPGGDGFDGVGGNGVPGGSGGVFAGGNDAASGGGGNGLALLGGNTTANSGAGLYASGGDGSPTATVTIAAPSGGFSTYTLDATFSTAAKNAIADSLLDRASAIETGLTPRQALRLVAAGDGGVTAGMGTASPTIKGAGVATVRVSATTDSDGNRTAVTLNL